MKSSFYPQGFPFPSKRILHNHNKKLFFMRRIQMALFVFILLLPNLGRSQEIPEWLNGEWEGVGYQAPTNSTWQIDLSYDKSKNSISIGYPSLNCSGHWELLEARENRLVLVERITEGIDNCDNNVRVVVNYVDEDYISIAYFIPEIFDNVVAYAVMKRKQKKIKKV